MTNRKYVGNPERLKEIQQQTGKTKKEICKNLPVNNDYAYQIFKGTKTTTVKTALTISHEMGEDIKNLFIKMED